MEEKLTKLSQKVETKCKKNNDIEQMIKLMTSQKIFDDFKNVKEEVKKVWNNIIGDDL